MRVLRGKKINVEMVHLYYSLKKFKKKCNITYVYYKIL